MYQREKMAEQDYRGGLSYAERTGKEAGRREGQREERLVGLRSAIRDICEVLGIPLDAEREGILARLDADGLEALRERLKGARRWPEGLRS